MTSLPAIARTLRTWKDQSSIGLQIAKTVRGSYIDFLRCPVTWVVCSLAPPSGWVLGPDGSLEPIPAPHPTQASHLLLGLQMAQIGSMGLVSGYRAFPQCEADDAVSHEHHH